MLSRRQRGLEVASLFTDKGFGLLRKPAKRSTSRLPVPLSLPLERHLLPGVEKTVAAAKALVT